MNRTSRIIAFVAVLLGIVLVVGACGDDGTGDEPRTVTVVGAGKVTGAPDMLRADIGAESEAPDLSAALLDNNNKMRTITDAVVKAGVDRKDIQTQQVTINPRYSNPAPGDQSQITGYQASNTVRVRIRDTAKASDVLAAAALAGGNNTRINNVAFAIDDDSELMKQAREKAFKDARARADQYAGLAGDSVGKVMTIRETASGQEERRPVTTRTRCGPRYRWSPDSRTSPSR